MSRWLASLIFVSGVTAATLPLGSPAPDFGLPGTDGKVHRLKDFAAAKALAVVFLCNSCPWSMLAEERIGKLYEDNRALGLALVAINPNSPGALRPEELQYSDVGESLDDMKVRAEFRHFRFPYLYDGDSRGVSMQFGPAVTPSVFVFDGERKLRYVGAMEGAENAIRALLEGGAVTEGTTAAQGCPVRWNANAPAAPPMEDEPVSLTLAGAEELKQLRANPTGKLLVVNFWATWCAPCVSEFADLQAIYRTYRGRGLEFVTVAENDPAEKAGVLKMLQKEHASTRNLVFGSADISAMQEAFDHNMGAAVPFTVVIAADGDVLYQESGEVTMLALRRAILENLPEPKEYAGLKAYWSAK